MTIQASRRQASRSARTGPPEQVDVAVVGSGFGGLGAALTAAEAGARTVLFETLAYPGGCASTFQRDGYRFESGATLFSGFGPGQLFQRWIERYDLDVPIDWLDPVVELRTPSFELDVGRDRGDLLRQLQALPGAPAERLERFFAMQRRVADVLWEVLGDPSLLPPLDLRSLLVHALRLPRYLPLARWVGRPLEAALRAYGLEGFQPLRSYLDGLCQITVQCGVEEAEAPFALGTMDYYWRGTGHVRGGIGVLASALCKGLEEAGGEARLACRVRSLRRDGEGWLLETRRGPVRARNVITNLLPEALEGLLEGAELPASMRRLSDRVREGWGACMLYRVARTPEETASGPAHLELILDESRPFLEGNHVFCSISGAGDEGRAPAGHRTLTVSTHVPMSTYLAMGEDDQARYVQGIQDRMRQTLAERAPQWERVVHELPASPRTFERFTGRPHGLVGGIPRRAGLLHYLPPRSRDVLPGLHLVGDSVFPGQSTLATALGGVRLVQRLSAKGKLRARTSGKG